jgi:glutathione S-transferase
MRIGRQSLYATYGDRRTLFLRALAWYADGMVARSVGISTMPGPRMTIELFGSRLSPFVEKVVRALHRKRLRYTLVPPRTRADFRRWSPRTRKMPVLEVDGARTFDSSLILRRLDELVPMPPLFDRDPTIAARQRFLEDWSDEALYWYGMGLRWSAENAAATAAQVADDIGAPRVLGPVLRMALRRQIGAQAAAQGLQRLPLDVLLQELERRLDELGVWLGDRPFLFADDPSAADLALFGQLRMLRSGPTPQAAERIAARPWLSAYQDRIERATLPPAS